ncbi:MAG: hypothetical protein ACUVQG_03345 [Thermogutta sp.]
MSGYKLWRTGEICHIWRHWSIVKRAAWGVVITLLIVNEGVLPASDWYVSPQGKAENRGTEDSPWDLASALDGTQKVNPGDTIWIAAGTYRHPDRSLNSQGFLVRLKGTEGSPIYVRAMPEVRVTIDGGLSVVSPSDYVWIWDLEILVSENFTMSRELNEPGSHPQSYGRPWGGLHIHAGRGCKYINLVIHDTAQGVSFWRGATDSELYGCIIYDNGWKAPDRGHGHAIYTQNEEGTKTIADCIMTGGFGYTMHAYGSERAYVDHYQVVGNIAYEGGTFLIGGGRPSRDIRVRDNILYRVTMQLGYSAPYNEDCEVANNLIIRGGLIINRFRQVRQEGNMVIPSGTMPPSDSPQVFVRPNCYDPRRAHVVIVNFSQNAEARIPVGNLAKPGDHYALHDPRHLFAQPALEGQIEGDTIVVPISGNFTVWILKVHEGPAR